MHSMKTCLPLQRRASHSTVLCSIMLLNSRAGTLTWDVRNPGSSPWLYLIQIWDLDVGLPHFKWVPWPQALWKLWDGGLFLSSSPHIQDLRNPTGTFLWEVSVWTNRHFPLKTASIKISWPNLLNSAPSKQPPKVHIPIFLFTILKDHP